MEGQSSQEPMKKSGGASPFDQMNRDDLLKKCKNLLMIAQKAKQAKDETLEEVKTLKEQISRNEIQKNADKESLKAMQEIVEKLTSDKLTVANEAESYKRKFIKLEKDTKEARNDETLKAQINKLIEENQGLITDLASLEKKFLQMSGQSQQSEENARTIEFLQTETSIKTDEIKALNERITALEKEKAEFTSRKEENDVEKFEIEEKIVLLEDQIQEKLTIITGQTSEIEALQNEIERLKRPDESIEKLKSEIFVLNEKIILLENENTSNAEILQELKDAKEASETECSSLRLETQGMADIETLKAEVEKYKEMNRILQAQLDDCQQTKCAKTKENEELDNLAKQFEKLKDDKERENQNLQQEKTQLETSLAEVRSENEKLKQDQRIKELDEIETKNLKEKITALETELSELTKTRTDLEATNLAFENEIETKNFEVEDAKQRISTLENNVPWYEEQFRKFRAETEESKSRLEQKQKEIEGLQSRMKQETETVNQLKQEQETSQVKALSDTVTALESELSKKSEELTKIRTDLQAKIDRLEATNLAFENEIETKNFEVEDAKQRISTLENNVPWYEEQFRKFRAETEESRSGLEQKEKEIAGLQSRMQQEAETVNQLKKEQESSQVRALSDNISSLEAELIAKNEEITKVKTEMQSKIDRLEATNLSFENEIETKNFEVEDARQRISTLENNVPWYEEQFRKFRAENEKLKEDLRVCEESKVTGLKAEVESAKEKIKELEAELERKQEEMSRIANDLEQIQSRDTIEKSHESEQINELNRELESLRLEKEEEIETLRANVQSTTEERDQLQKEISKLEEKDAEMLEMVSKMNAIKTENAELLSELKEINEILKERGEIINIQMTKISDLDRTKETLESEYRTTIETLQKTVKELQEKPQERPDTSDAVSTSTISRMDESARMKEFEDSYEEKYNKLRGLAVKLKKKVTEQNALIAKMETETAQTIQKENDALKDRIEEQKKVIDQLRTLSEADNKPEVQDQIQTLKDEKDTINNAKKELERQVDEMRGKISELQAELQKAKAAIKKTSVMNLEIEAYEKSLNDLNNKLEAKKQQVKEFEATITSQNETIEGHKNEIKILEDSLESEKTHAKELKQQIDMQQTTSRESEHEKSELKIKVDELTKQLEQVKLEFDENRLQLADLIKEKERNQTMFETEKNKFIKSVFGLEEKIETLSQDLKNREIELDDVKTEYAGYKVRAQSVLRQNQTKETGREKELEEELTTMQETYRQEQENYKQILQQKADIDKQCAELNEEKQRIQGRCKDLLDLLEEVRIQGETFAEESQRKLAEKEEQLKTQKIQADTLRLCYEKQIQELVEKHNKEVDNLKVMVTNPALHNEEDRVPFATTDEQKISMLLLQREEGEGSESTNPYPLRKTSRSRRDLIPLDELLSSPFEETITFEDRPVSPTVELHDTKERLSVQEARVKHLTSLLAEAEQDLGKLTQLNEVLKEEVRRQQRSIEREQHVHNSEYLKNVILKFLTLSSGDERSRLVPVLNTILKLSPDETQKLENAAKGGEGITGRLSGFLPMWSNNN